MVTPPIDDFHLNPNRVLCDRCGLTARGSAFIGDVRYCHPDEPTAPDCYTLQARENHAMRAPTLAWIRGML